MKLTAFLIVICAMLLTIGCSRPAPVASTEALFCDVEEPRRFTQAELDWRAANAPWNLRRDYKTNLAWERECGKGGESLRSLGTSSTQL